MTIKIFLLAVLSIVTSICGAQINTQTLNNGESGLVIRNKINNNFTTLQAETISIASSATPNFRADAASVVQLSNGNYLMVWGEATGNIEDSGLFDVYGSFSIDDGKTYSIPSKMFNRIGGFSTYMPSVYKRANNSVFMIVLVQPTLVTSELWKVESNDGGLTWSGTQTKLYGVSNEYYAPFSDRIFRTTTGRLIYPFNKNTNPPNLGSQNGNYVGMFLYSDDDGVNWSLAGTSGANIVNSPDSFVGEPGIYREYSTGFLSAEVLVCYFRCRSGYVFAARSLDNGLTWGGGPSNFNIGLPAQNSTTTIKFDLQNRVYIAATNKYWVDQGHKNELLLWTSKDARTWSYSNTIEANFVTPTLDFVFEPIIYFVNDLVKIVYSATDFTNSIINLKQKTFPRSYISTFGVEEFNSIKIKKSFATGTSEFLEIYADNVSQANGFYKITNISGNGNVFGIWHKYKSASSSWGVLESVNHPGNGIGRQWEFSIDGGTGPLTNTIFRIRNGSSNGSGGTIIFDMYPQAVVIPKGTTAQRPGTSGTGLIAGAIRYNTDDNKLEYYNGTIWVQL